MILTAFDVETTGLSPKEDCIIEVGMVVYEVESKQIVATDGFFVIPDLEIPDDRWSEAEKVHHITRRIVNDFGLEANEAFNRVCYWFERSDVISAHNGNVFDKLFYDAWVERLEGIPEPGKLWIDTRTDLPDGSTGRLIYMAAERGFVDPFPHRAVTDSLTLLRILQCYDIPAVVERAKIPSVTVQALVSYDDRDKAKARGYQWAPDRKAWLRSIKETEVEKEKAEAGFRIAVVRA